MVMQVRSEPALLGLLPQVWSRSVEMKELDVVELVTDRDGFCMGTTGTIVGGSPEWFTVEACDPDGRTIGFFFAPRNELRVVA